MSQDKLDYFIERTDKDLAEMKKDIKHLIGFRMLLLGMASAVSAIVSLVIAVYFKR